MTFCLFWPTFHRIGATFRLHGVPSRRIGLAVPPFGPTVQRIAPTICLHGPTVHRVGPTFCLHGASVWLLGANFPKGRRRTTKRCPRVPFACRIASTNRGAANRGLTIRAGFGFFPASFNLCNTTTSKLTLKTLWLRLLKSSLPARANLKVCGASVPLLLEAASPRRNTRARFLRCRLRGRRRTQRDLVDGD